MGSQPEGMINIDTEPAKQLGFTSDRFEPDSYLWRYGNTIVISFIIAKQKGMFCQLMQNIYQQGFDFEIPTPSQRMIDIGIKQKWKFCNNGEIEFLTNKTLGEAQ